MARRHPTGRLWAAAGGHVLLAALALASVTPFFWIACAAVKTPGDLFAHTFLPWRQLWGWAIGANPWPLTGANFATLFEREPFLRWLWNSIFLSATHTVLTVTLGSMGGFALAKYAFRGKRTIMAAMVLTMLLPSQVLLPSSYELMYRFGWVNSYLAILVPGAVSVFGVLLFRQAMAGVPDELLSAGRVDGCSELRLWWEIAMPVVRPMTGAYTLMSFLAGWNSYLWPQIVLQDEGKYTLPMGLANMAGLQGYQAQYGVLMAGTLLSLLPVVLLFFALQKDFVAGLTTGAVKG
jgi:ABC-type glycerol-3-phosphate transport system permease component